MKYIFLLLYAIACLLPVYGQNDTITKDGLFLKYNSPYYHGNSVTTKVTKEMLINKDFDYNFDVPNDSDMRRGELDRATKSIGLTYKRLPQYTISESFGLNPPPKNPVELHRTTLNSLTSQWIHEDGECILFIKCSGSGPIMHRSVDKDGKVTVCMNCKDVEPTMLANKSIDEMPKEKFNWIKQTLGMGSFLTWPTEKEMQEIKRKITIWSPKKAKKTFNAQHVITYPIKNKKSVYMGKYTHKRELIMVKWGESLTVSFLVTKKGNRNIKKYIRDVEEAFWFED